MEEVDSWLTLAELVGLLGLALAFSMAARRLGQKPILGYLVAGFVAGPKALNLIGNLETVRFLAELGVALLLFSIGLEFSWHRIGGLGRRVVIAGGLQFGFTAIAGAAAAAALGLQGKAWVVMGGVLALSSTAFVFRILEDRTELDSRHGRVAVGVLLLQDILLIPLLVIQGVIAGGASGMAGGLEIVMQLGRGAILVLLMYLVVQLILLRAFRGGDAYGEREVPIILSVLLCMGCAWASHWAGLSPVLGAFLAGVMLADQPVADQVRANVMPLRAVFVTLFFTSIGMLAGVPAPRHLGWVLLAAAGIVVVKAAAAWGAIRIGGWPSRTAVLGGLAIAQIGEFSFVLAEDALQRGLLPAAWFEPLVAASVLTLAATPYLFAAGDWLARRRPGPVATGPHEPQLPVDAIVVGYGPAGREVVHELVSAGRTVTVVESNPDLTAHLSAARVITGDGAAEEILRHAGLTRAKVVILTIPDPGVARTVLGIAKGIAPDVPVIVRARYHRFAGPIARLGAEAVVDEEVVVGRELALAAARQLSVPRSSAAG
jgi:CPA2 family monovalent cation:H+ antiporter-2